MLLMSASRSRPRRPPAPADIPRLTLVSSAPTLSPFLHPFYLHLSFIHPHSHQRSFIARAPLVPVSTEVSSAMVLYITHAHTANDGTLHSILGLVGQACSGLFETSCPQPCHPVGPSVLPQLPLQPAGDLSPSRRLSCLWGNDPNPGN